MSKIQPGSASVWLISIVLVLSFIVFLPLPHYHHDQGWFMGSSVGVRFMGDESYAAPIDKVISSYVTSNVQSPFELSCETDLDCKVVNITNQCKSYCTGNSADNLAIVEDLGRNRVCDPAFWKPEIQNCQCIFNKCLNIKY